MSTHNIGFHGKIRKICGYPPWSVVILHKHIVGTDLKHLDEALLMSYKNIFVEKYIRYVDTHLYLKLFPTKDILWVLIRSPSARCF